MNQSKTFENTHTTRSNTQQGKNDLSAKILGFNDNNHKQILEKVWINILGELKRLFLRTRYDVTKKEISAIPFFLISCDIHYIEASLECEECLKKTYLVIN